MGFTPVKLRNPSRPVPSAVRVGRLYRGICKISGWERKVEKKEDHLLLHQSIKQDLSSFFFTCVKSFRCIYLSGYNSAWMLSALSVSQSRWNKLILEVHKEPLSAKTSSVFWDRDLFQQFQNCLAPLPSMGVSELEDLVINCASASSNFN